MLRSRHAHARVVSIDARRALDLPGVHAVLTAADVPDGRHHSQPRGGARGNRALSAARHRARRRPLRGRAGGPGGGRRPLPRRGRARPRSTCVYEPLPVCARRWPRPSRPGAPRLFPGTESNNVAVIQMRVGDADAALAGAPLVLRERFTHPRQTAAALETRGLVAVPPDPRGGELHLIGSTKCIHINRAILAPIFGIPPGALRLTEVDVGGGFGVRGRALSRGHPGAAGGHEARPARALDRGAAREPAGHQPRARRRVRGGDRLRRRTGASSACAPSSAPTSAPTCARRPSCPRSSAPRCSPAPIACRTTPAISGRW